MKRCGIFLVLTLGILTWTPGCAGESGGGETEVYKGIEAEIRELNPDDTKQMDSLKEMIQERAWRQTRKIVELLHSEDETARQNAMALIMQLGDLSLPPLLEASGEASPENRVRDLKQAVDLQLANRTRLVAALDSMMDDRTVLKPTMLPIGVEEVPPPRRVCDEAYVMMRLLFALEDEETQFANKDVFLDMTDEERDAEIKRARETQKWISLTEEVSE